MSKKDWEWFGSAGHFICAASCRFHLCTKVGNYLVSTVGEYWPDSTARMIHARIYDPQWVAKHAHLKGDTWDYAYMARFGFEEIGSGRKYETMVFKAGARCTAKGCNCGLPSIDPSELDAKGYNDAGAATRGHMAMCEKWSKVKP